jgi:hypothetical protein
MTEPVPSALPPELAKALTVYDQVKQLDILARPNWLKVCRQAALLSDNYSTDITWSGVHRPDISQIIFKEDALNITSAQIQRGRQHYPEALSHYRKLVQRNVRDIPLFIEDLWETEPIDLMQQVFYEHNLEGMTESISHADHSPYFANLLFEMPEIVASMGKLIRDKSLYPVTPNKLGLAYLETRIGTRIIPEELQQQFDSGAISREEFRIKKQAAFGKQMKVARYNHVPGFDTRQQRKGLSSIKGVCPATNEEIIEAVGALSTLFSIYWPLINEYSRRYLYSVAPEWEEFDTKNPEEP